jgi:hypothetical protein
LRSIFAIGPFVKTSDVTTDLLDPPALDDVVDEPRAPRRRWLEPGLAVLAFAFMVVVVFSKAAALLEPDDYAYRASIVALTHGELLLTNAQYSALVHSLSHGGLGGVAQWHHLRSGYWISEKNPGYPFLAVLFDMLGILRATPLIYGAIGCVSLYVGGRRWLGRWGGTAAVALFCTSGAALAFAWRATMPTFTDAALIATGAGLLLWVLLANDVSSRRRTVVASLASVAFMAATFVRYTDVFVALVASAALAVAWRSGRIPARVAVSALGVMASCGALILVFNDVVYGHFFSTGYSAGEISFSLSAVPSNLVHMPLPLVVAMPMTLLAVGALVAVVARRTRREGAKLDLWIAGALALGWAAIWGLYMAYPWTVGQPTTLTNSIHVIRFYVPVLGLVALLGAWALLHVPRAAAISAVSVAAVVGVVSFASLTSTSGPGGLGGPPGSGHFGPGGAGAYGPGQRLPYGYGPPPGGGFTPPGGSGANG